MEIVTLKDRIIELEQMHGGIRPAARAIGCDPSYLVRLRDGEKNNPSTGLLRRLGLKKEVVYVGT